MGVLIVFGRVVDVVVVDDDVMLGWTNPGGGTITHDDDDDGLFDLLLSSPFVKRLPPFMYGVLF